MPNMVIDRDLVLRSRSGYTVRMSKNKPKFVPPKLVSAALMYGAKPVDGEKDDISKDVEKGESPPVAKVTLGGSDKLNRMVEIIEEAVVKKTDGAFTAIGKPNAKYLEKEMGAIVTTGERDQAWAAYQQKQTGVEPTTEAVVNDDGTTVVPSADPDVVATM